MKLGLRKTFEKLEEQRRESLQLKMEYEHAAVDTLNVTSSDQDRGPSSENVVPFVRDERKVGRNELCPCGSGKKFKQCHGSLS